MNWKKVVLTKGKSLNINNNLSERTRKQSKSETEDSNNNINSDRSRSQSKSNDTDTQVTRKQLSRSSVTHEPRNIRTSESKNPISKNNNNNLSDTKITETVYTSEYSRFSLKLSTEQKATLRSTWTKLHSNKFGISNFVHTFYETFFVLDPTAKRLFDEEGLEWQSEVLSSMINWVLDNLDNTPQLVSELAQMGKRHKIYGVKPEDYKLFSTAVAKTFEKILNPKIVTPAVYKAWEDTLNEISKLMIDAANVTRKGFRHELLRERNNGAWTPTFVSLTLDTLYLFKDSLYTQLIAQYTLHGVEALMVVEEPTGIDFCFSLKSDTPPFLLRLGNNDEKIFGIWLQEIDWRLQAIHRVYNQKENSSGGDSPSIPPSLITTSTTSKFSPVPLMTKQYQSTRSSKKGRHQRASCKLERSPDMTNNGEFSPREIKLSERQKMLVKESWEKLLKKKIDTPSGCKISAITQVFDEFYVRFFEVNPSGKRLFEQSGMASQGHALIKMMAMIVKGTENSPLLAETITMLGGRHTIYGVEATDYVAFSNAMCATFESVLGKVDCDAETRDAWYKVMMELSAMMQDAGSKIKKQALSGVIWRKLTRYSHWKKSQIVLTLDTLYVYRDEKNTKLRSSYPIRELSDIDIADERVSDPPTQFGFILHLNSTKPPEIFFCTENVEELNEWMNQFNWRIQATQRVYRDTVEELDLTDIDKLGSSSMMKKAIGKFQKKIEKRDVRKEEKWGESSSTGTNTEISKKIV